MNAVPEHERHLEYRLSPTGCEPKEVELISEVVEWVAKATLRRDQFQTSINYGESCSEFRSNDW